MFTSIALALALASPGAPIPKDAPPTGIAPRIVDLKPDSDGKILVQVRRTEMVKVTVANGAAGGVPKVTERQVTRIVNVELVNIKDLKITTAGGKDVELKDAMEKLKGGGIAVMTNDGKPVSIQYLRILKDDILVLSSPELIGTGAVTGPSTGIGGFKPLPLPLPIQPGNNIAPGGIQIQIVPGIQQLPPVPVKD